MGLAMMPWPQFWSVMILSAQLSVLMMMLVAALVVSAIGGAFLANLAADFFQAVWGDF